MPDIVGTNNYGKKEITFLVVDRKAEQHAVREFSVSVKIDGDFAAVFAEGDNRSLLPTGSMTNTVYAIAHDHVADEPEVHGAALTGRFLTACPAARTVQVDLSVRRWNRPAGTDSPYSFSDDHSERDTVTVQQARGNPAQVVSGLAGLRLSKTTENQFTGFLRDEYTVLPEQHDRLVGAVLDVSWEYSKTPKSFADTRSAVRAAIVGGFGRHRSLSGQHTMHVIAVAALRAVPELTKVHVECRAQDHVVVDFSPFGQHNERRIYVAPATPYSGVHLTVERGA